MFESPNQGAKPLVWQISALCRAVADSLDSRFNPVAVSGEISGFSRAASGHCYFSIKDDQAQIRCAMFRRAASLLDFQPREGELVELRGRLALYEARGDLQLVVESMRRFGVGALFEQFLQLKARLQQQGLFDAARKRPLPLFPRAIGVVTSLQAAALHDVLSVLRRRAPQVRVIISPARVQGAGAAAEICEALSKLYLETASGRAKTGNFAHDLAPPIDLILLVRGGGSIEDLWAFNDERLAHAIVQSPVPVVVGVGHETDFTIADFCADLRAPTPTAAAELAIEPRGAWADELDRLRQRLHDALQRTSDAMAQRLDRTAARLTRPSALVHGQQLSLAGQRARLVAAGKRAAQLERARLEALQRRAQAAVAASTGAKRERIERAALGLSLLDPALVLERGYAWLADEQGAPIVSVAQTRVGQALAATLADGTVDLEVTAAPRI
ncbi:MAG: exodeoxyribonuclease VII large subunit [Burkholderiales bacterium]